MGKGFRDARSICAASQTMQKHGHNHMSKTPEIDLSDLRDLLRACENYLTFASKGYQLHENDTGRLLARTPSEPKMPQGESPRRHNLLP